MSVNTGINAPLSSLDKPLTAEPGQDDSSARGDITKDNSGIHGGMKTSGKLIDSPCPCGKTFTRLDKYYSHVLGGWCKGSTTLDNNGHRTAALDRPLSGGEKTTGPNDAAA